VAEREHEHDAEHQVTPLELFFDLTFVFAITQVTILLADNPTEALAAVLPPPKPRRREPGMLAWPHSASALLLAGRGAASRGRKSHLGGPAARP
jgi:hypothetical protein